MTAPNPISFEVDLPRRVRRATFQGVITEGMLFRAYEQLLSDPSYDATLNDLVDLRGVERLEVGGAAVRRFVGLFSGQGVQAATRLAIVAPAGYIFGMARMYEILSDDTPEEIQVFQELGEAERWLGSGPAGGPQS